MKPKAQTGLLIWLVLSQALALLSLLPWVVMAGLSFMAFDSGVSTGAIAIVVAVCSYPLVPLVCAIVSWVLYARRKVVAAAVLTGIPVVIPGLFWLVLMLGPDLGLGR